MRMSEKYQGASSGFWGKEEFCRGSTVRLCDSQRLIVVHCNMHSLK